MTAPARELVNTHSTHPWDQDTGHGHHGSPGVHQLRLLVPAFVLRHITGKAHMTQIRSLLAFSNCNPDTGKYPECIHFLASALG